MCGIFGLITNQHSKISKNQLLLITKKMFLLSESRGKEASGFVTNSNNNITYFKSAESASDMINSKEFYDHFKHNKMPISILGHSRLVTNGSQELHDNNQPVYTDDIIGVHNGIITNVEELWKKHKSFNRQYEIDTEIIFKLIRFMLSEKASIKKSVNFMYDEIIGTASIATFFRDLNLMLFTSNNGSLYFGYNIESNIFVFCSEEYMLKQIIKTFQNLKVCSINIINKVLPGQAYYVSLTDLSINNIEKNLDGFEKLKLTKLKKIKDVTPTSKKSVAQGGSGYYDFVMINKNSKAVFDAVFKTRFDNIMKLKRCQKCILPITFPYIHFDENNICNYCKKTNFRTKSKNFDEFKGVVKKYKKNDNSPDCLIPFSGGRDSTYGLYIIKEILGLNPITFTYDWGMVTNLARRNIARVCGKLGVENIIVSADIKKKRENIKKNVLAWLRNPDLGIIPLFMAGDKQFFYYVNKIKKQTGLKLNIWMGNSLEETDFKTAFCNIKPDLNKERIDKLSFYQKLLLLKYYGVNFFMNKSYFNSGLLDTIWAYHSYYFEPRKDYFLLFDYLQWDEKEVEDTIIATFNWEVSPETNSTWRIGDGTAPFYNYIYLMIAGFSENDTFRSNQIRRGMISRDEALKKISEENLPRWNEIKWYCDTIGIDLDNAISTINQVPSLYNEA